MEGAPADPRSSIDALFEKAKANGARTPEEMTSYRSSAFGGAGRRLGHDQGPSVPVQPLTREEKSIKITFYRNGFTVDEGPLRNPNDPAEAAFLETLNRGFMPREISEKYPNTDVNVVMGDRGDEDYVPQFKAFEGSGNRLASSASAA